MYKRVFLVSRCLLLAVWFGAHLLGLSYFSSSERLTALAAPVSQPAPLTETPTPAPKPKPTEKPTDTPAPGPVADDTETPTPTDTPAATATWPPTATMVPTASPTPSCGTVAAPCVSVIALPIIDEHGAAHMLVDLLVWGLLLPFGSLFYRVALTLGLLFCNGWFVLSGESTWAVSFLPFVVALSVSETIYQLSQRAGE